MSWRTISVGLDEFTSLVDWIHGCHGMIVRSRREAERYLATFTN